MVDADVLTRRLLVLNEALGELQRPEAKEARALLSDRVLRAAVERWLQLSIEACIDLANHVIASNGWPPPATGREAFLSLAKHGRLDPDLARRLGRAVGLRNVLVHDYVSVDLEQLASIVRDDLDDLRAFAACAARWLE